MTVLADTLFSYSRSVCADTRDKFFALLGDPTLRRLDSATRLRPDYGLTVERVAVGFIEYSDTIVKAYALGSATIQRDQSDMASHSSRFLYSLGLALGVTRRSDFVEAIQSQMKLGNGGSQGFRDDFVAQDYGRGMIYTQIMGKQFQPPPTPQPFRLTLEAMRKTDDAAEFKEDELVTSSAWRDPLLSLTADQITSSFAYFQPSHGPEENWSPDRARLKIEWLTLFGNGWERARPSRNTTSHRGTVTTCAICSRNLHSVQQLGQHYWRWHRSEDSRHLKEYVPKCTQHGYGHEFSNGLECRSHSRQRHGAETQFYRDFMCEFINPTTGRPCDVHFTNTHGWERHRGVLHDVQGAPNYCLHCEKWRTTEFDTLYRHIDTMHSVVPDAEDGRASGDVCTRIVRRSRSRRHASRYTAAPYWRSFGAATTVAALLYACSSWAACWARYPGRPYCSAALQLDSSASRMVPHCAAPRYD
ncbi:hypothetical protein DOTSEDRAFT_180604, partial [Dothistroma septosporum NZE10]